MLLPHRSWPELVMHVLAHVAASAGLPASVYDSVYVAWAERALGPAGARELGEDAALLGRMLSSHEGLAQLQLLAWLFDDAEHAKAVATRDLDELEPDEVDHPELLPALVELGAPVEVLRCAAELEREALAALGPPRVEGELEAALAIAARAAPGLEASALLCLRSLRLRGRVRGDEIWIGAPAAELELSVEHVAWQAAHEASVSEVARAAALAERRIEAVALVLLAERAAGAGLSDAHRQWLSHLAGPPSIDADALTGEERALLASWLAQPPL